METRLVSRTVYSADRDDSTRMRESRRILTSQCILTPFNSPSATQHVLPLSKYIEETGNSPSPEEAALIGRCLRKGLTFLRSKTKRSWSITEDEIAVQVNSSGKVSRAFVLTSDPVVIEMLVGSKEQRNHIIHAGFMKKLTESLEQST